MITAVSTVLCIKSGTEEHLARREELWQYMKNRDENLYRNVRRTAMGRRMQLKSSVGRKAIIKAYGMAQKIFSFN